MNQNIVIFVRKKLGDPRVLYLSERHLLERAAYDRMKRDGYDVSKIPMQYVEKETP